jgi:hypothetical protein
VRALEKLYLARTIDEKLFPTSQSDKTSDPFIPLAFKRSKGIESEVKNHYVIKISDAKKW